MITSKEQAERVQQKRYDSGKHGVAKAVRRFLHRTPGTVDLPVRKWSHGRGDCGGPERCKRCGIVVRLRAEGHVVTDRVMAAIDEEIALVAAMNAAA